MASSDSGPSNLPPPTNVVHPPRSQSVPPALEQVNIAPTTQNNDRNEGRPSINSCDGAVPSSQASTLRKSSSESDIEAQSSSSQSSMSCLIGTRAIINDLTTFEFNFGGLPIRIHMGLLWFILVAAVMWALITSHTLPINSGRTSSDAPALDTAQGSASTLAECLPNYLLNTTSGMCESPFGEHPSNGSSVVSMAPNCPPDKSFNETTKLCDLVTKPQNQEEEEYMSTAPQDTDTEAQPPLSSKASWATLAAALLFNFAMFNRVVRAIFSFKMKSYLRLLLYWMVIAIQITCFVFIYLDDKDKTRNSKPWRLGMYIGILVGVPILICCFMYAFMKLLKANYGASTLGRGYIRRGYTYPGHMRSTVLTEDEMCYTNDPSPRTLNERISALDLLIEDSKLGASWHYPFRTAARWVIRSSMKVYRGMLICCLWFYRHLIRRLSHLHVRREYTQFDEVPALSSLGGYFEVSDRGHEVVAPTIEVEPWLQDITATRGSDS